MVQYTIDNFAGTKYFARYERIKNYTEPGEGGMTTIDTRLAVLQGEGPADGDETGTAAKDDADDAEAPGSVRHALMRG
eukprot:gene53683-12291_t